MHIHPAAAFTATFAAGTERAAAQRAAEVRKRLFKSAQSVESDSDPDAAFLVGQWLDFRHSQVLSGDEYQAVTKLAERNHLVL